MTTARYRIGLISDTHGLLRPEALAFLAGVERIVHGGDIGGAGVLEMLGAIAPVTAVRGNNDRDAWSDRIRETEVFTVGKVRVLAIHDLAQLDLDPAAAGIGVVISGHSHKPTIDRRGGVVFINPGSAGRRRFRLPVSIGEMTLGQGSIEATIVELPGGKVLFRV